MSNNASQLLEQIRIKSTEIIPRNTVFLSNLLPYDPKVKTQDRLRHGLNEYQLILLATEQAMHHAQNKNIAAFDCLVGENSCQIRALKTAFIFTNFHIQVKFILERINSIKADLILLTPTIPHLQRHGASLQDILDDLDLELCENALYLVKTYLLAQVKMLRVNCENSMIKQEYTDEKQIQKMGNVGITFAENITKKLRQNLAQESVAFVQGFADTLFLPDPMIEAISDKYVIMHNKLPCLPSYWSLMLVFMYAIKSDIPLIIRARQVDKDQGNKIISETTLYYKKNRVRLCEC